MGDTTTVFVYGTLTDPGRVASLLDDWAFRGRAVIEGLDSVAGTYPTLIPGDRVTGRLLETTELDRLDGYEAVDRGLYIRVAVPGPAGDPVRVYVAPPTAVDAEGAWPGPGPFRDRVEAFVDEHDVRVHRPDR